MTPSVSSWGPSDATLGSKQLAESLQVVCTPVCTNNPKTTNETNLDALAAALMGLSPDDRARLAAMLLGKTPESK